MSTDLVGESLGAYTIVERIGRGGMADVYKAVHNSLAVHRALKVILPELVVSSDFRTRFQKEAQAVASLRHPNIVQVHDFGTHNSMYFMVMEFIEGSDLKRVLRSSGRIRPIQHAVDLVVRISDALEYAHARGLIHRDIKPENVMITAEGQPILMDFGIAKLVTAETKLTQTGASMGTPAYMAPEQALGSADICPATDIYSLSIVLYELLTGQVPFTADTPVGVVIKTLNDPLPMPRLTCPEIGDELQSVIVKGAAKNLAERYNSVAEFRAALQAAVARDTVSASSSERETMIMPRTLERRIEEPRRRNTAMAAGIAAVAVVAAGAVYWVATRNAAPNTQAPTATPVVTAGAISDESASAGSASAQPPNVTPEAKASPTLVAASSPPANQKSTPSNPPPAIVDASVKPTAEDSNLRLARAPTAAPAEQSVPPSSPAQNTSQANESRSTPPAVTQSPVVTTAANSGSATEVRKGVTTQGDLLRLFGGPNLTTYDESGLETWIYERTSTQTDTRTSSQSREGSVSLGLFFKSVEAGASASKESSSARVTTSSTVRSVTVIVKFAPDRTVHDYTVRETYF